MARVERAPAETMGSGCSIDYPRMKGRVPTVVGDVLVLETHDSCTIYVVGPVLVEWQSDFLSGQVGLQYEPTQAAALAAAKRVAVPGSRIFMRNLKTGEWLLLN